MNKTLIDLIVEPYLLLFIEYLEDPGLCLCNHYCNDIYHLSIVNKEIYSFMAKYKKLSVIYPKKHIPITLNRFFSRNSYCIKHDIISPLTPLHIDMISKSIQHITDQRNYPEKKTFGMIEWEIDGKISSKEFIHCKTKKESSALKKWILQHTYYLVHLHDCCSGTGFEIDIQIPDS